jgi:replicative DNA helicase
MDGGPMNEPEELRPRRLNIDIDDDNQRYPLEKMTGALVRRMPEANIQERGGRMPPQAVDVEQAVLGAVLIEPEAIPRAIELLNDDSFYSGKHRKIFSAVMALFERNNPVDLITVSEELKRRGDLEDVGGSALTSPS